MERGIAEFRCNPFALVNRKICCILAFEIFAAGKKPGRVSWNGKFGS